MFSRQELLNFLSPFGEFLQCGCVCREREPHEEFEFLGRRPFGEHSSRLRVCAQCKSGDRVFALPRPGDLSAEPIDVRLSRIFLRDPRGEPSQTLQFSGGSKDMRFDSERGFAEIGSVRRIDFLCQRHLYSRLEFRSRIPPLHMVFGRCIRFVAIFFELFVLSELGPPASCWSGALKALQDAGASNSAERIRQLDF